MNVMTIDVEDWYHSLEPDPERWSGYADRVEAPTRRLLELFEIYGTRATFFVLGHVAELHPDLVREIASRGHEVGSHGYYHRFAYRQTREEFAADVARSIDLLKKLTGKPVTSYRAPYFSITAGSMWALEELARLGIRHDSSVFPVHNPRYGVPGAPALPHARPGGLTEVPPSTFQFAGINLPVAGGVYFRFAAYPVLRAVYRKLERRGHPVVFYLHPWELDPGQPRVALPAGLRLRHYWALRDTERKLCALLQDFRFRPIREVSAT